MAEQTSLRQFIPEPTTSLMSVEGLSGYTQQNPLPVDERDRQEAARELSRRGITAQAPVPSNQSVMAAPTSINPFNPAFRETARSALNDFFGGSNIAGREGYRTGQMVDAAVGAMDFAPALGDAMGVGDLRQSISARDPVGIGINTIAMLPVIGDPTAKALRSARALGGQRQLNPNLDQSYETRMQRAREQGYLPETVYHGTAADFDQFNPSQFGGSVTSAGSAKMGTWFSDKPSVAAGYARMAAEDAPVSNLIRQADEAGRSGDFTRQERLTLQAEELEPQLIDSGGQNIIPARIRGNLMEIDAAGATMSDLDDSQLLKWSEEAKSKGFDGLKIKDFSDNADYGRYDPANHYLIFDEKNIRSKNAEFDPSKMDSADLLSSVNPTQSALRAFV